MLEGGRGPFPSVAGDLHYNEGLPTIQVDYRDNMATITLNAQDKLNSLSCKMMREIMRACDAIDADAKAWVILFAGGRAALSRLREVDLPDAL